MEIDNATEKNQEYLIENEPIFFTSKKEDLELLLSKMVEYGASCMFVMGNKNVWMSTNGKKVRITEKTLSNEECEAILNTSYNYCNLVKMSIHRTFYIYQSFIVSENINIP